MGCAPNSKENRVKLESKEKISDSILKNERN